MSKNTFERLMKMTVDEIINEDFTRVESIITEDFDHPFSIEETEQYFLEEEGLTEEEMYILMENKIKELWKDDNHSKT